MKKDLLLELAWISGILLFVSLIIVPASKAGALDIQIHDTYFVIDTKTMIYSFTLTLSLVIFIIRILFSKLRKIATGIVFLFISAVSVVLITPVISFMQTSDMGILTDLLTLIQAVLILSLIFVSFLLGRRVTQKKDR